MATADTGRGTMGWPRVICINHDSFACSEYLGIGILVADREEGANGLWKWLWKGPEAWLAKAVGGSCEIAIDRNKTKLALSTRRREALVCEIPSKRVQIFNTATKIGVSCSTFLEENLLVVGVGFYPLAPSFDQLAFLEIWDIGGSEMQCKHVVPLPGTSVDSVIIDEENGDIICCCGARMQGCSFLVRLACLSLLPRAYHELPGTFYRKIVQTSATDFAVAGQTHIVSVSWVEEDLGLMKIQSWRENARRELKVEQADMHAFPSTRALVLSGGIVLDSFNLDHLTTLEWQHYFTGFCGTPSGGIAGITGNGELSVFENEAMNVLLDKVATARNQFYGR